MSHLEETLRPERVQLPKAPTGIRGLDEITGGGLPRGRTTLLCGGAGCGKTLFAMEFLVRGATEFGEPGVFVAFEETADELAENVRSLGFHLTKLEAEGKVLVESIQVERSEIEETGDYDLEGLFIRLGLAIDSIGAKRVVLDTIENLFGSLTNTTVLRAELRRLFRWLKERGTTAVLTGERGEGQLTRHGLEEYVSDCVILLDQRVVGQLATRRLRVVKYRGTFHGTNEYPFLIEESGVSVLPVTSMGLEHRASDERISSGVPQLDAMLGGHGYFRGSSIMVTGSAGTGKTSLAAHFANAACERGERCLYFAFEESESQIVRNMSSIGIDLRRSIEQGLLRIEAARPSLQGLEAHLVAVHKTVQQFGPRVVVVDPISSFSSAGTPAEVQGMLLRLIDFLKAEGITAFLTSLTAAGGLTEGTDLGISSLIDTWLLVRDLEAGGERNRGLYVLKSRGMAHSNQIREFLLTGHGIELLDVHIGDAGLLTGSLRAAQEARDQIGEELKRQESERRRREIERKRKLLEAQILALRTDFEEIDEEEKRLATHDREMATLEAENRDRMAHRRGLKPENNAAASGGRRSTERASPPEP